MPEDDVNGLNRAELERLAAEGVRWAIADLAELDRLAAKKARAKPEPEKSG